MAVIKRDMGWARGDCAHRKNNRFARLHQLAARAVRHAHGVGVLEKGVPPQHRNSVLLEMLQNHALLSANDVLALRHQLLNGEVRAGAMRWLIVKTPPLARQLQNRLP